jgi:hypothetical protein
MKYSVLRENIILLVSVDHRWSAVYSRNPFPAYIVYALEQQTDISLCQHPLLRLSPLQRSMIGPRRNLRSFHEANQYLMGLFVVRMGPLGLQ